MSPANQTEDHHINPTPIFFDFRLACKKFTAAFTVSPKTSEEENISANGLDIFGENMNKITVV